MARMSPPSAAVVWARRAWARFGRIAAGSAWAIRGIVTRCAVGIVFARCSAWGGGKTGSSGASMMSVGVEVSSGGSTGQRAPVLEAERDLLLARAAVAQVLPHGEHVLARARKLIFARQRRIAGQRA